MKKQLTNVTWVLNQKSIPATLKRDLLWCDKRKAK